MSYTFKPLWKLLIDKEMTREQLRKKTNLSSATMAKLAKDGNVTIEVLARLYLELGVQLTDICRIDEKKGKANG
ncbi:helix-turn-helix domain-containing protein [Arcanobacterium ihumii]|uniref:helix-turn-helix domain-containing protein n=1 Tax=Arcanobacterium ihumii TaxID=2138162 RepID=UPI000F52E30A|nr:helix-turn-helix transcriptional regulator [Arcanobacterium ihumii]